MIKKLFVSLRIISLFFFLLLLVGCEEAQQDDVYKLLDEKAKVKTFPLTIVLTDPLNGDAFPDDLKTICGYASGVCKTLPAAGILRLGPDQYYTYNPIASLDVSSPDGEDEQAITKSVQTQVSRYFITTKLPAYDSLRAPSKPEDNTRALTAQYVQTNKDSIFFYSPNPYDPPVVVAGGRNYPVYKNAAQLRRVIDEIICRQQISVSIFYSPAYVPAGALTTGIYAGDTCVGTSRYEKLNDGKGNLFVGKLLEKDSKRCGFTFPTGIAGDTCIGKSRYQRMHNGRGGFTAWQLLEKNSTKCGFIFPTGVAGDTCVGTNRFQKMHDSRGGFILGNLLEKNSLSCGYTPPKIPVQPKPAVATPAAPIVNKPVTATTQQTVVKPAPVINRPAPRTTGTVSRNPPRPEGSDDPPPAPVSTDKRCARTSEPTCEQDDRGNYTGRRVQYCYNSSGKIVRTIVLSKCDRDCRCF